MLLTCALGLIYVGYQSVQGERGLLGWIERSADVERTRAEVAALAEERRKLERRVSQLREARVWTSTCSIRRPGGCSTWVIRTRRSCSTTGRRSPAPTKTSSHPDAAAVISCHGKQ